MKSTAVANGNNADATQYNNLREDAKGAGTLLAFQQSTPGMTLQVSSGSVFFGTNRIDYAGGNSPTFVAPVGNPRIDLLYMNDAGTLVILQGTAAGSPVPPTTPPGVIPICHVYLRVSTTAIYDTDQTTNGYVSRDIRPITTAPNSGGTFNMTEKTGVDINQGEGVFIDSNGDAIKEAILKTLYKTHEVYLSPLEAEANTSPISDIVFCWLTNRRFAWACKYNTGTTYFPSFGVGDIDPVTGKFEIFAETTDLLPSDASANCFLGKITKIAADKFMIQNDANSSNPVLRVIQVDDDNNFTLGTALTLSSNMESSPTTVMTDYIEDNKFIISRRHATSDDCEVTIGTVSGTTITVDTANWQIVDTGICDNMWVKALSLTQAIVAWNDGTNLEARICNYGTGTGNTVITLGSGTATIAAIANIQGMIERVSDTSFVIAWRVSASLLLRTRAGSIDTNTITLGSTLDFRTGGSGTMFVSGICPFGKNGVIIHSYDPSSNRAYQSQIHYISVSGTTVTAPMMTQITRIQGPTLTPPSSSIVVASAITFVAGTLLTSVATGQNISGDLGARAVGFRASIEEIFLGVAEANSNSNNVTVIPRGRTGAIYSSLTYKGEYFVDTDGVVRKTGLTYVGQAIKTTEIFIK